MVLINANPDKIIQIPPKPATKKADIKGLTKNVHLDKKPTPKKPPKAPKRRSGRQSKR